MITISIDEEVNTNYDMVYVLQHIAGQIEQGLTSGIEPGWTLEGQEEESEGEKE